MLMCICMLNKRTNILFDVELWKQLVRMAKDRQTSVGQLVREAVRKTYFEDERRRQIREAIDEIRRIRPHLKGPLDYKAMINEGRKY